MPRRRRNSQDSQGAVLNDAAGLAGQTVNRRPDRLERNVPGSDFVADFFHFIPKSTLRKCIWFLL